MQQVLARAVARRWASQALEYGTRGRLKWFLLTTALLGVGWLLGNVVPDFEDFISLFGALFSTQMTFSFPCVFYLLVRNAALLPALPKSVDIILLFLTWAVLVINVYLTICGTTSAVMNILHHARSISPAFGCLCTAKQCAQSEFNAHQTFISSVSTVDFPLLL